MILLKILSMKIHKKSMNEVIIDISETFCSHEQS